MALTQQVTKRITSISLKNYRAYYGKYHPIRLPGGQNLLIYGENGSGKSSLFKAINNYLTSSRQAVPFTKNRHTLNEDGEVAICFSDFDIDTFKIIQATNQSFYYGSANSTNNVNFIKDASLVKGFLDYTDLLNVYFHQEPQPNLFELIVLKLLGNHIPVSSGGNFRFSEKWKQLQDDLIKNSFTRQSVLHKRALRELPIFQTHLKASLNEVFTKLNFFLRSFFPDLKIQVGYELKDIQFNYASYKWGWYTTSDLRLKITKDDILITGGYSDVLNEARMSAFAICLYLASLKCNPSRIELKVLYLDDIFIGLDASNRIPILNILNSEFLEYQIFISTYDRYTYELAKRHFETAQENLWVSLELYVGKKSIQALKFDIPLVISEVSEFSKAVHYLHHSSNPDYPAAANYFRKYAENILSEFLPSHEIKNDNYETIETYKLTKLVKSAIKFFNKIHIQNPLLLKLRNVLPTILHPLSHFNLISPVYRNELIETQECLFDLNVFLNNIKQEYRQLFHQSMIVKLRFNIGVNKVGYYEIFIDEMIYLMKNSGATFLSKGKCRLKCTYIVENEIKSTPINFNKNLKKFQYSSLSEAYDTIFTFVQVLPPYTNLVKVQDYTTEFEIQINNNMNTLVNLMVW